MGRRVLVALWFSNRQGYGGDGDKVGNEKFGAYVKLWRVPFAEVLRQLSPVWRE